MEWQLLGSCICSCPGAALFCPPLPTKSEKEEGEWENPYATLDDACRGRVRYGALSFASVAVQLLDEFCLKLVQRWMREYLQLVCVVNRRLVHAWPPQRIYTSIRVLFRYLSSGIISSLKLLKKEFPFKQV